MRATKGASVQHALPPPKKKEKEMKQQVLQLPSAWQGTQRKKTEETVYPIAMVIFSNCLDSVANKKERAPTQHQSYER